MTGVRKPSPLEAFETNMRDAHHLVRLAEGLTNSRARKMRKELRDRVGAAWRVPLKHRDQLDCLESADVYLVFKPVSRLARADFLDHRPLLRQALVAACAATETYLADRAMSQVAGLTSSADAASDRLKKIPMTVGDWLDIEVYEYRRRGLHEKVIRPYFAEFASVDPSKVGALLSLLGVKDWQKQLDGQRGVNPGDTRVALDRIAKRRNRIVHTGDRVSQSSRNRATLSIAEVRCDLDVMESLVAAVEKVLA